LGKGKGSQTRPVTLHIHEIDDGMSVVGEDPEVYYGSFKKINWVPNTIVNAKLKGPWLHVIRGRASRNGDLICIEPEFQETIEIVCTYKISIPEIKVTLQKEGCTSGRVLEPEMCRNPAEMGGEELQI
jgi:hypothetical protein